MGFGPNPVSCDLRCSCPVPKYAWTPGGPSGEALGRKSPPIPQEEPERLGESSCCDKMGLGGVTYLSINYLSINTRVLMDGGVL